MFVSNKVGQIQTLTPSTIWRYVPSADNPADVASRDSNGQELPTNQLIGMVEWSQMAYYTYSVASSGQL